MEEVRALVHNRITKNGGGDDLPSEKTISSLRRNLLYEVSTLETRLGYIHDEGLTGENHVTIQFNFFFLVLVSPLFCFFLFIQRR